MRAVKMVSVRTVCAMAQLVAILTELAMGQTKTFRSPNGAQVTYFRRNAGFRQPQMMVMQVSPASSCK